VKKKGARGCAPPVICRREAYRFFAFLAFLVAFLAAFFAFFAIGPIPPFRLGYASGLGRAPGSGLCRLALGPPVPASPAPCCAPHVGRAMRVKKVGQFGKPPLVSGVAYFFFFAAFFFAAFFAFFAIVPPEGAGLCLMATVACIS